MTLVGSRTSEGGAFSPLDFVGVFRTRETGKLGPSLGILDSHFRGNDAIRVYAGLVLSLKGRMTTMQAGSDRGGRMSFPCKRRLKNVIPAKAGIQPEP